MDFKFLHISDIHFGSETSSQRAARQEILDKIKDRGIQADCLIISGDILNRGIMDVTEKEEFEHFIDQLPGHEKTIVVPGNHDLDRCALVYKPNAHNVTLTRREKILEYVHEITDSGKNEFTITDADKDLIYRKTFGSFLSFCKDLNFLTFNNSEQLQASEYEVQSKVVYNSKEDTKIRFVLLNTALISGQAVKGQEYRNIMLKHHKEYQQKKSDGKRVDAAKLSLKIERLRERFENDGELIIDEEGTDPGTQSLSKKGNELLSTIRQDNAALTIFVGHHGIRYLSEETEKCLKTAMKNCQSGIYLCGHTHQEGFQRIGIQSNSLPRDAYQFQSGVTFKADDDYTQYGFNYGTLVESGGEVYCRVEVWCLTEFASGEQNWVMEVVDTERVPIQLASRNEKNYTDGIHSEEIRKENYKEI